MEQKPDKVILNTIAITMDPLVPSAQAVAVLQDRILAVGSDEDIRRLASPDTQIIDGQGLTMLPGFIDSHIHLLSLARTTQELDCSPQKASCISEISHRVFELARIVPPGEWVRCYGYDDVMIDEHRHPTRHDLDEISPRHPVRLDHRSGHASVLNSLGLKMLGINSETPDPIEGVIDRDDNGEPTGVMFEMSSYLSRCTDFGRSRNKILQGVTAANRLLLSHNITSVQDAGHENGPERWQAFRDLTESGALQIRITMMAGQRAKLLDAGLSLGFGNHQLRLGHVKIMLTMSTGALHPNLKEFSEIATEAIRSGFPIAVHCVEQETVKAAAQVIANLPPLAVGVPRHRIEHCSECPPDALEAVQESGSVVVTQPGFIHWNGPRYRRSVAETLQPHLYPIGPLNANGITVAFGSDAPVINPNPWPGIYSAVTGKDYDGIAVPKVGSSVGISAELATRMYTVYGAESEGTQKDKGSITPGKLADLALVNANPLTIDSEGLKDIKGIMTMIGGVIVWQTS